MDHPHSHCTPHNETDRGAHSTSTKDFRLTLFLQDHNPLRSISRGNLLLNRPVQEQGKKFLLFLYHSPAQADPDSVDIDSEKQVMDLNERVRFLCSH